MSPARITLAVAALTLVTAAPASAKSTVFGGNTRAGEPIALTGDRAGKKLTSAVIAVEAPCTDGTPWVVATKFKPGDSLDMSRNAKGRFAGTASDLTAFDGNPVFETLKLSGRLAAHRASGTLSLTAESPDGSISCHTGTIRWSTTRSPGHVYAGMTRQQEPVVVKVDKARTNVDDVLIGWETASCTPDGWTRHGEDFTDFPLRASHFGDGFTHTYADSSGGKLTLDYTIDGTVRRTASTGTLHVALTRTDASGATTGSCDSGTVAWKAATG